MSSGLVSQSQIDGANDDIVEVISRYLSLKKTGKNWSACCPFHKENSPSFSVSDEKQIYYCFGCGAGGDAVGFVMRHLGVKFRDAVEIINGKLEIERGENRAPVKRAVRCSLPDHREDKERSLELISKYDLADTHQYLLSRNTAPKGRVMASKGHLMVRVLNSLGELVNVAAINRAGYVKFSAGGPSYGSTAVIEPAKEHDGRIIICADYAHAWRIWWASKCKSRVLATLDTGVMIWMLANCKSEFTHVGCDPMESEWFTGEGFNVVECGLDPYAKQ